MNTALIGGHYPIRIITHYNGRARVEETVCGRCIRRRLGRHGELIAELWPCRASGRTTTHGGETSP